MHQQHRKEIRSPKIRTCRSVGTTREAAMGAPFSRCRQLKRYMEVKCAHQGLSIIISPRDPKAANPFPSRILPSSHLTYPSVSIPSSPPMQPHLLTHALTTASDRPTPISISRNTKRRKYRTGPDSPIPTRKSQQPSQSPPHITSIRIFARRTRGSVNMSSKPYMSSSPFLRDKIKNAMRTHRPRRPVGAS